MPRMDLRSTVLNWELSGFAERPAQHTSCGGEFLFRCFSPVSVADRYGNRFGSRRISNFFFAFRHGSATDPIRNPSWIPAPFRVSFLERNLNAALWNNTYGKVALFCLLRGVHYLVGTVGHETRGIETIRTPDFSKEEIPVHEEEVRFQMDSFGLGAHDLVQVVLDVNRVPLERALLSLYDWPIDTEGMFVQPFIGHS
jgi:hypothetical protein